MLKKNSLNISKERKRNLKIRTEIKETKSRKTAEKNQWNQKLVFEKVNETDKSLAGLTKEKGEKLRIICSMICDTSLQYFFVSLSTGKGNKSENKHMWQQTKKL